MPSLLEQLRKRSETQQAEQARESLAAERPSRIVSRLRTEVAEPRDDRPSLLSRLDRRMELIEETDALDKPEIERICELPIIPKLTKQEQEAVSRKYVLADKYEEGWRLLEPQASALVQYSIYGGLLGPIGVGKGKTLISVKIADLAYRAGKTRIMLLVPAGVYGQLVMTDIPELRLHVSLIVPFQPLGGKSSAARLRIAKSKRKGCYIIPYSCLSTTDSVEVLDSIRPDCIISDEGHLVKNPDAARTKRLMNCLTKFKSELVVLSGTITKKSIRDYHHLARQALRQNCPLPHSPITASEWGVVLDSDAEPTSADTGPIEPLVKWARRNFPKANIPYGVAGFRAAYRLRLTTAPGVVATSNAHIGTSLTLCNRPIANFESKPGWTELKAHMDRVVDEWTTPSGDEIDHAIHTFKWLLELTAGFYNELVWPEPLRLAERMGIPVKRAAAMIEDAQEHHEVSQEYARELRKWLRDNAEPGLDTPFVVGKSMSKDGPKRVSAALYEVWSAKKALEREFKQRFAVKKVLVRDARPVRVCSYKVVAAVKWAVRLAAKGKGGLIWGFHQAMCRWAYEALQEAGVRAVYCPAGNQGNTAIRDPKNANKIVVASMSAHGTGKNLQQYKESYFLQWPRSADLAEQVIGRNHRTGQDADSLDPITNNTTDIDVLIFAACLNDALYVQQSLGTAQKLMFCGYDPMPKVFPPAVLRERGLQPKRLTADQQRKLAGKFGVDATAVA